MATKSSTRSSKKKTARPGTASVRGRAAKTTRARTTVKSASPKTTTKTKAKAKATATKTPPARATAKKATTAAGGAKYRQSGAPWWKAFL